MSTALVGRRVQGVMAGPCPSVTRNSAPGCVILKKPSASPFRWCVTTPGTPKVLRPLPCVRPCWVAVAVGAVVRRVAGMAAAVVVAVVVRRVVAMVAVAVRGAVVAPVAAHRLAVAAPSKSYPDPFRGYGECKKAAGEQSAAAFFMAGCQLLELLGRVRQTVRALVD